MNNFRLIFSKVVLPIVVGCGIYALFRGMHFIDPHERIFPALTFKPPDWFAYNLPDGLWLYALLSSIDFIWKDRVSTGYFGWIFFAISISYLTEFFQAIQIIPGTFDWKDLLAYTIAIMAFFLPFGFSNEKSLIIKNKKQ